MRALTHSRGFSAVVILTLAIGVGANTAIFSLVDAVVLRPLPYPDANRIVTLSETNRKGEEMMASWLDFTDWRDQSRSFSGMAAIQANSVNFTGHGVGNGEAIRLYVLSCSHTFFSLVGVHPVLGRDFLAPDDRPGAIPVALLSNSLWKERFGADPHVLGRSIDLSGRTYTIIGVLPASFRFYYPGDLYVPIGLYARSQGTRADRYGTLVVGKVRPDVALATAAREMETIAGRLQQSYPASNGGITVRLHPLTELITGPIRRPLFVLWSAVCFVLLIACANVANLLLARAVSRQREITVRIALGAGRGRLISQLLTESAALAISGAIAGCAIAAAVLPLMVRLLPIELSRFVHIGINPRILGFTLLLTVLTTALFGLIPAYRTSGLNPAHSLGSGTRTTGANFSKLSATGLLVTTQIALAFMLLIGACLLAQSLMRLDQVNPGFRTDHLLTARLNPGANRDVDKLIDKVNSVSGVLGTTAVACLPLAGKDCWFSLFLIEGRPIPRVENVPGAPSNVIAPGYLKTMGIPLLRGRDFSAHDDANSPPVILVNERFARKFFPGEDPIGKRIKPGSPQEMNAYATIVGVIGDVRREQLDQPATPEFLRPMGQTPASSIDLLVRTISPNPLVAAPAVRRAVAEVAPDTPLYFVRSMEFYINYETQSRRFPTFLLSAFAGIAVLLATVGLYGLLSFLVAQRTKELGIRLALGAQSADLMRMVMQQGLGLVIAGLVVGLAGAWELVRVIGALLFATAPNDALVFAAVSCLLLFVAALACWFPARRATKVDPLSALRAE